MANARPHIIALLLILLTMGACGSCEGTEGGERWDVEDRTDTSTPADTSDDVSDAGDASTPSDTSDATDASDAEGLNDTIDTNDTSSPAKMACLADPGSSCPIQQPTSWGDCAMPMGVVFNGDTCMPVSGCGCEDDCPAFDSMTECAQECGRAGQCEPDDMPLVESFDPLECSDTFCGDRLMFCVNAPDDPTDQMRELVPGFGITCEADSSGCHLAPPPDEPEQCGDGDWCCTGNRVFGLEQSDLQAMCGATLLSHVKQATCFSFE